VVLRDGAVVGELRGDQVSADGLMTAIAAAAEGGAEGGADD
jgi:ribose transport system ATP-binding protein